MVLIVAFVVTLGAMAAPFVSNAAGAQLLWGGVVLLGLLVPLGLHLRPRFLGPSALVVASLLTLGGGLILRYVVIMVPQAVFGWGLWHLVAIGHLFALRRLIPRQMGSAIGWRGTDPRAPVKKRPRYANELG